ncbi:hypothetical protein G9A89_013454 [Geosiphon pyriformis]|nr:hypothetical protein G9A89_013454 [Geosiphon pyriformis]
MEPVSSSAGGSGSILAGLGTRQSVKSKCVDTPKKPVAGVVVDSSAGSLGLKILSGADVKPEISWKSEVGSVTSSVSNLLDIENMVNTIAEKTNDAEKNSHLDICAGQLSKFNQLSPLESRAPEIWNFNTTKSFTLNIELSAVPGKLVSDKLISLKKIFYRVDGFGRASIPSKFSGIIKSSFTLEFSLNKARKMAICEKILVNDDVKKANSHSDWEVIVKEIPINLSRSVVESVFSKFGKIVSIKMQLIGLWQKTLVELELSKVASQVAFMWSVFMEKDSVCVALVIKDKQTWVSRDQHQALLYTLPVGTTAHDLSDLLVFYGEKSCFISCNSSSYVCDRCAVICFGDEASKLAAIGTIPIFKSVSLYWAGLFLACCSWCKQFGHISINCSMGGNSGGHGRRVVSDQDRVCLAEIYKKKMAPIAQPVSFGGKTWAQVAGNSSSHTVLLDVSGSSSPSDMKPLSIAFGSLDISDLSGHMASLECFLEFLANQISGIVKKLSFVELVPLVSSSCVSLSDVSVSVISVVDLDMALDGGLISSTPSVSGADVLDAVFSSSGSKVLTSKVGGLESKISALEALIGSVLARLDLFDLVWKFVKCNVQGINVPAKQTDVVCWHVSSENMVSFVTETKLKSFTGPWIKDKFDGVRIFTSGLDVGYFGAGVAIIINNSLACYVSKIEEIPGWIVFVQLLFKGKLSVTVLGLYTGASPGTRFSQAFEVNSIIAKAVNTSTFVVLGEDFNESGSGRSASFRFCLGLGLVNSFADHHLAGTPIWCNSREVEKTIDYIFVNKNLSSAVANAVMVSVGLSGLLNAQLNSLYKQAKKNCWKFRIRDVDSAKWIKFKNCVLDKLLLVMDFFSEAEAGGNLDAMWAILERGMVKSTNKVFARHWFSEFQCSRNKYSSRFFGLELFVAKIVSKIGSGNMLGIDRLTKACAFSDLVILGENSVVLLKHLSLVCKEYRRSKMFKSKLAEETSIRKAIKKHMESFAFNKGDMIQSVLDWPFHKVVNDNLVLEPEEIKSKVDKIMIRDDAFSGVMKKIDIEELLLVVGGLPDSKATGLSGIPNKLWKHGSENTSTQSLVFAVGAVVEDAFKKNRKLWLISSKFVSKLGQIEGSGRLSSYFATGVFVDNTIWVGNCQAATQNILDIASEFFVVNDIFINNEKTVTIPINQGVKIASLSISGLLISIAKKGETYCYLGIFLSTEGLSKPSVAKTYSDVCFFANVVFRKAIINKQFSYLVLAILQSIVSYCTQFSFVSSNICNKWDVMLRKSLKSKAGLSCDFLSEALYYLFLYGLKSFEQMQSKGKLAILISFSNSSGVLGHLFEHSAGASLAGSVESTCFSGMSILDSEKFSTVVSRLHEVWSDSFKVFMDGLLKNFGGADVASDAVAFFSAIDMSIGIKIHGLLSSTMAELQAIALSLECVPSSCTVVVHTDSQAAIDVCISEMSLSVPDFRSSYWLERHQIFDLVHKKNLSIYWVKIKGYSGVDRNVKADAAAGDATGSGQNVISDVLIEAVDWDATVRVWHPNLHMLAEVRKEVLVVVSSDWLSVVSLRGSSSSAVLQFLGWCSLDVNLYSVLCKEFVLREWCMETVKIFDDRKEAVSAVVGFVGHLVELHHSKV